MLCYKDMTFCSYWNQCKNGSICQRALTPYVEIMAQKVRLPICQYTDKPECLKEVK